MINNINQILLAATEDKNPIQSKIITNEQFKELIDSDYNIAWQLYKENKCIYKGINKIIKNILLCTPGKRISQNTTNYYTYLMSEILPSWKKYPKRNSSFICTNTMYAAGIYGMPYIILPKNGAKIGICPSRDIWWSFIKYMPDLTQFNHLIYNLFDSIKTEMYVNWRNTLEYFNILDNMAPQQIDELYIKLKKQFSYYSFIHSDIVKSLFEIIKHKGCVDGFDKLLNSKTHNFSLITLNNFEKVKNSVLFDSQRECWTDSECIITLSYDKIKELREIY